jgi:hypothetical protein
MQAQNPQNQAAELQRLRQRAEDYNERRQRALVEAQAAEAALQEARREAEERFGTSDLAQLKQLLAQTQASNAERLRAFAAELEAQEKALGEVEAALRSTRSGT